MIKALLDDVEIEFDPTDLSSYGGGMEIATEEGDFILFEDAELAGDAAREYWKDMVLNDPEEFTCIIGVGNLVSWCLGQYAGPGSTTVNSLDNWLDVVASVPEEHWASYDSYEREFKCEHPDFVNYTVAYRIN